MHHPHVFTIIDFLCLIEKMMIGFHEINKSKSQHQEYMEVVPMALTKNIKINMF